MVTRPAEGSCFCLATVSVFSLCPSAAQVQETARAREHAARATSPLSRVTAAVFPGVLSPASTTLPRLPPEITRVSVFAV